MSAEKFLVTGATGRTGRDTVQRLVEKGHAVRALVHREDERSEALRGTGAEVVIGDLLDHDDAIRATAGTSAAYFCYPVRPGLIQATAYFADAAKRADLKAVINMSQISAREDSKSHAARDHWIAERVFDWSGVPIVHLRPTFSRSGCSIPFRARPLSKKASSICRMARDATLRSRRRTRLGSLLPQYRERLEKAGLLEFMIQHFCAIALDYQNGIFAGEDKIIAEVTGQPPMTVQEFVTLHRNAFNAVSTVG
jgi:NAD(P)H dehydrogenase (quinone)